jgi:hypothetical protein
LLSLLLLGCAAAPEPAPMPAPAPAEGRATLRLGEEARIGAVRVRAMRLVEDSRCPVNVQCVHAGTVRLAVTLNQDGEAREVVLRDNEPQRLGGEQWIELSAVCPVPRAPNQIASGDYRFIVSVAGGGPPPPLDFACPRGT